MRKIIHGIDELKTSIDGKRLRYKLKRLRLKLLYYSNIPKVEEATNDIENIILDYWGSMGPDCITV